MGLPRPQSPEFELLDLDEEVNDYVIVKTEKEEAKEKAKAEAKEKAETEAKQKAEEKFFIEKFKAIDLDEKGIARLRVVLGDKPLKDLYEEYCKYSKYERDSGGLGDKLLDLLHFKPYFGKWFGPRDFSYMAWFLHIRDGLTEEQIVNRLNSTEDKYWDVRCLTSGVKAEDLTNLSERHKIWIGNTAFCQMDLADKLKLVRSPEFAKMDVTYPNCSWKNKSPSTVLKQIEDPSFVDPDEAKNQVAPVPSSESHKHKFDPLKRYGLLHPEKTPIKPGDQSIDPKEIKEDFELLRKFGLLFSEKAPINSEDRSIDPKEIKNLPLATLRAFSKIEPYPVIRKNNPSIHDHNERLESPRTLSNKALAKDLQRILGIFATLPLITDDAELDRTKLMLQERVTNILANYELQTGTKPLAPRQGPRS